MALPVVLVVEDDASVQSTLCATLTLVGFTTFHAATVDEALGVLGREQIDAITLDIRLQDPRGLGHSGLTLLAFLRATTEYANIPVVIFTGMPLSPDDEAAARRHNAHVFHKPARYSSLIACLSELLNRQPAA